MVRFFRIGTAFQFLWTARHCSRYQISDAIIPLVPDNWMLCNNHITKTSSKKSTLSSAFMSDFWGYVIESTEYNAVPLRIQGEDERRKMKVVFVIQSMCVYNNGSYFWAYWLARICMYEGLLIICKIYLQKRFLCIYLK